MKVGIVSSDIPSCELYRARGAAEALAAKGEIEFVMLREHLKVRYAVRRHGPMEPVGLVEVPEVDVVVFVRGVFPSRVHDIIGFLQREGIAVVVDFDDDYEHLPPELHARYKINPNTNPYYNWANAKKSALLADQVTVSTDALRRYGKDPIVIRNAVPASYLDIKIPERDGKTVAWGGVVGGHPGDLRVPGSGVADAIEMVGGQFINVGDGVEVQDQLGLRGSPLITGIVPLDQYPIKLAQADVHIAPLVDNVYSRAKCLDQATMVMTEEGLKPIGEVSESDRVWHLGWHEVQGVEHSPSVEGLLIETRLGMRLRLTPNHRLQTPGEWRRAEDLLVGDELELSYENWPDSLPYIRVPWPAESRMSPRSDADPQGFMKALSGPSLAIDPRWGRILGLYAGDGSGGTGGNIQFSMDGQDADLIQLLMADINAIGLHAATSREARTWDGKLLRRRYVSVASMHLVRVFESLGILERKAGGGTRRIVRVPEVIWRSPRSVSAQFLSGLFEADGHVSQATVGFCTKDESFARDVHRLLVGFGIYGRLWKRPGTGPYKDRVYWNISLGRAASEIFARQIGFLSQRKRRKLALIEFKERRGDAFHDRSRDEIVAISKCDLSPVDLQVEGSIFAAYGIVSHNSWLKPLEALAVGAHFVASPTPEYRRLYEDLANWCAVSDSPVPGGLAGARGREWRRELLRALRRPEKEREEAVLAAREYVRYQHNLDRNCYEWAEAWERAIVKRRRA